MDSMERLEIAVLHAERHDFKCMTMAATLCELYRVMPRGFTDSEADAWTTRLNDMSDRIERQNKFIAQYA